MMHKTAGLGLVVALVGLVIDQATKWTILTTFADNPFGKITVTPFFDLVLVWNRGISYGLFQAGSQAQVWFLVAIMSAITVGLLVWLLRNTDVLTAWALGLLIGGAIGNAIDRAIHGAVVDFVSLHAGGFHWYVFNLADVWVVAGVALLLYDAFVLGRGERISQESQ